MNIKKLQNLTNTWVGKIFNPIYKLNGYSPFPPLFVMISATSRCNLNCKFCYQAAKRVFDDISFEDAKIMEKSISSIKPKPRIHFFGGEPTVNKDFIKIANYFDEKGYPLSMTTNGVGVDKFAKDLMALKNMKELNISINIMNWQILKKTLDAMEKFKKQNPVINLNCPITEDNYKKLVEVIEFFEKSKIVGLLTFQFTTFPKEHKPNINLSTLKDQIKAIKSRKFKIPIFFLPNIKEKDINDYYNDTTFPKCQKCMSPWFMLLIKPSGDVIPCDEIDIVFGNVKQQPLSSIWNNKKFRLFRKNINKRGLPYRICHRCCRRQYY